MFVIKQQLQNYNSLKKYNFFILKQLCFNIKDTLPCIHCTWMFSLWLGTQLLSCISVSMLWLLWLQQSPYKYIKEVIKSSLIGLIAWLMYSARLQRVFRAAGFHESVCNCAIWFKWLYGAILCCDFLSLVNSACKYQQKHNQIVSRGETFSMWLWGGELKVWLILSWFYLMLLMQNGSHPWYIWLIHSNWCAVLNYSVFNFLVPDR